MTESYGAGVDLAVAEPVLTTPAARASAACAASAAADCAFAAAMVDAAIGDLDLVLDLELDAGPHPVFSGVSDTEISDLSRTAGLVGEKTAGPAGTVGTAGSADALGTVGTVGRVGTVSPVGSGLPESGEQHGNPPADSGPLVAALVQAYARRRGMPVGAVMLAYPLHDARVVERLVADLARAQGTSEAVVRLTFGQPTPR